MMILETIQQTVNLMITGALLAPLVGTLVLGLVYAIASIGTDR
jgi:hypothetical protein